MITVVHLSWILINSHHTNFEKDILQIAQYLYVYFALHCGGNFGLNFANIFNLRQ